MPYQIQCQPECHTRSSANRNAIPDPVSTGMPYQIQCQLECQSQSQCHAISNTNRIVMPNPVPTGLLCQICHQINFLNIILIIPSIVRFQLINTLHRLDYSWKFWQEWSPNGNNNARVVTQILEKFCGAHAATKTEQQFMQLDIEKSCWKVEKKSWKQPTKKLFILLSSLLRSNGADYVLFIF